MDWKTIKKSIADSLISRGLKDPKIRLRALDKIELIIQHAYPLYIENPERLREVDKAAFKRNLSEKKGYRLNGAENSVVNEIYYRVNPEMYIRKIKS